MKFKHNAHKIILLLACVVLIKSTSAQKSQKTDSIYYLIDTTTTLKNDRMWDVHEESPALKFYEIKCSCLKYNSRPTFGYDLDRNKGTIISKKDLLAIKLISLPDMITASKKNTDGGFKGKYKFFIIEPLNKKYIVHEVKMFGPFKPEIFIDYEILNIDSIKKAATHKKNN
jgi:hypothetical protein